MKVPDGFFVVYEPKYKVPSVFDLNSRGMFNGRPFVTQEWGHRIITNEEFIVKMQFLCLKEKSATDPVTNLKYNFVAEEALIELDEKLLLNPDDLKNTAPNQEILEKTLDSHEEWRQSYVPVGENNEVDKEGLEQKLLASINDRKEIIRKELVRRNSQWVNAAMPKLVQDFRRGLFLHVEDRLYDQYKELGGKETEKELINRIMLFHRIYDGDKEQVLLKPNGGLWKNEDEVWECWVGFAGAENEAKRVCRTMESVFIPLAQEISGKKQQFLSVH